MVAKIVGVHPEAVALCARFEGYHRRLPNGWAAPYRCPANVPTIGHGATFYEGGRRVKMGDPAISADYAEELLAHEMRRCAAAVNRLAKLPISPRMAGALTSFAFNCGIGALKRSTLLRRVNDGRWEDVPAEFAKWRMGGGRVLPGLVRRREAEAALFMAGVRNITISGVAVEVTPQGAVALPPPVSPKLPRSNPSRGNPPRIGSTAPFWRRVFGGIFDRGGRR